ncbi:TM1802 family CRISPR-associated protein [Methanosphaera sp. WGK6]|uniref:TM1802 family CRISPR-associated protein n=1 Tax=Methanosphaera sp. WGK6 TaxID=1561964 RepID=UPI00084C92DE|nr:TM1802 family CRISPR-associated protein [Methanosphaera sp. WGK6]OED29725.1 hypothetical protein NL43_06540 [Methanosphaera sp. WGK6]
MENNLIIKHRYVLDEILITDDKKASFLLGFLTRKLTHMEYHKLKKTPFLNKIYEIDLNHDKIKALYPVMINEIRKYDAIFKELEEEASISLLKSDKNWNINDEETSFYFTLGYTLGSAPNYKRDINDKEITS